MVGWNFTINCSKEEVGILLLFKKGTGLQWFFFRKNWVTEFCYGYGIKIHIKKFALK